MGAGLSAAEARVRLVTRAIVAVGFTAALVIFLVNYLGADPSGFELDETKSYLRNVEMVGGTANVLATDFRHWIGSLWHGNSLAVTVAVLSLLLAGAYNFLAMPMQVPGASDSDPARK